MTTAIFFSSPRLGETNGEQLQRMLDRHGLGRLLAWSRTGQGAMNQTLRIETDTGAYIFKGNPLYPGQLEEERWFSEQLATRTKLPLPVPYVMDERTDLFGWSYAIMPCLPGRHLGDLPDDGGEAGAQAAAEALRQIHAWTEPAFGEYDPRNGRIVPFEGGYFSWLSHRVLYWLKDAARFSDIGAEDEAWAEGVLRQAELGFAKLQRASMCMGDFKPGNFLLEDEPGGMRLSGLFDLTNGYFGDPLADLPKLLVYYRSRGRHDRAARFLRACTEGMEADRGWEARLAVHLLHQNVLDWGCLKAMGAADWPEERTFRDWAADWQADLAGWLAAARGETP
ncbi:aminoglycoside phosphotransferase family protein [Paenibacillus albicereus]|uniref:Aminoglycoside phosphotransferase family protein n=1 Tax=Paenibacillus albicereus TaxID=2726185 RepID=A0A6H2H1C3_9BACL|nr:aminoglycoside phosphotransferase family protein [Paenibacillus albicereus]QJC53484.1 aminoglycoside phosphotransferase family protein [Paenibacillus albicereus]